MEILKKLNMRRINLAVAFPIKTISTDSTKNFNQKKKITQQWIQSLLTLILQKQKKKKINPNSEVKYKFKNQTQIRISKIKLVV